MDEVKDFLKDLESMPSSNIINQFPQPIVFDLAFVKEYTKRAGGCLFGSKVYNSGNIDVSDFDFVMPLEHSDNLKLAVLNSDSNLGYADSQYYISGYYFNSIDGHKINITGCKVEELKAWNIASRMMAVADNQLISKDYAQVLFESILAILKKAVIR